MGPSIQINGGTCSLIPGIQTGKIRVQCTACMKTTVRCTIVGCYLRKFYCFHNMHDVYLLVRES